MATVTSTTTGITIIGGKNPFDDEAKKSLSNKYMKDIIALK